MKLTIYKTRTNHWRWRVKARNGKIVASSSEEFETQYGAKRNVRTTLNYLNKLVDKELP